MSKLWARAKGRHEQKSAGFTIVEMMVALSVLAVMLLTVSMVVMRYNVQARRALTQSTAQTTARTIQAQATEWIQFTSSTGSLVLPGGSTNSKAYCIGDVRISYILGRQSTSTNPNVLISDRTGGTGCAGAGLNLESAVSVTPRTEHVSKGMRLSRLAITEVSSGSGLYQINVRVVYGDDDLLCASGVVACNSNTTMTAAQIQANAANLQCKTGAGSEYCAVSELVTTAKSRL